ncbi:MAG: hypothetical protein A2289_06025 [Deltaproteobacteria bacterium RIFOXYA12_FULL_58_15]|nr:MAG: hypothetical protein A2289_06025 [Deltaproteobacteria bacterium RIFOXYA12_FULL_58_15]OGR12433.1 MAG: hypothetical protein A2341_19940 [Deltaproteobacteria bacterium RIFOXYB12_FULL_58_9]
MDRTCEHLLSEHHFVDERMAFLVGPRQVGKTTVARLLLDKRRCPDLYRSWDDLEWRRAFVKQPYAFIDEYRPRLDKVKPLVVLDEIHKHPRWKRYIKGLWDTRKERVDLLVTGSGRLDVYQRGGDSMLGRYHQYRLHPLSVHEVLEPKGTVLNDKPEATLETLFNLSGEPPRQSREAVQALLRWGGFPEPFLKQNTRQHRLWLRERRDLIVREDLRDISRIQLLSHVEELVELIALRAGHELSYNALREDLQVALDSVRLWVGYLQRLHYLFIVRPFTGKIARALRREPKLYLWDWSEIEDPGARFENLVASHLLKWCHFTQDWGLTPLELHYLRDKEKREVDFLITRDKKPWLLVEAKLSDTQPSPALMHFAERLGDVRKIQVVLNCPAPGVAGGVLVLDSASFLGALPV